ncbi:cupin domain-containing protein [Maribacter algicola]|uniref:Cupin domain-containing protein n=1 Tax=Maribacter algicola TaxID=2498892 RepID=A0A3R8R186_9FLAO|nr:cupin domain-containing protein [Maribacter algicola]RRQ48016.1 cupin domain-containing protein [Maribacter algicola]
MIFDNLLSTSLEGVHGKEVILSSVEFPPNTALPKHWHPGEEFVHVLEGTLCLWQEESIEMTYIKGDTFIVPYRKIHAPFTKEDSAKLLIFRVHEKGMEERYLVE